MATITTVQQLADSLDVPEKKIRRWLREEFPKQAPGQGGRWVLTTEMKKFVRGKVKRA